MNKHQEDTKYLQWEDGMYVMLDELLCDYEAALVEDSLRDIIYYDGGKLCFVPVWEETQLGVFNGDAGTWHSVEGTKLTRAQALYIATGDTTCIGY
jgi:hypothetical protein